MKTVWIGMMAITFVLGIGVLPVIYVFGRMMSLHARSTY